MSHSPIPYGRQQITQADINAVVEVLQSDYLTTGPRIAAFEEAFAAYIGAPYAVAVANGTAALHLSALALGSSPAKRSSAPPIPLSLRSTVCATVAERWTWWTLIRIHS